MAFRYFEWRIAIENENDLNISTIAVISAVSNDSLQARRIIPIQNLQIAWNGMDGIVPVNEIAYHDELDMITKRIMMRINNITSRTIQLVCMRKKEGIVSSRSSISCSVRWLNRYFEPKTMSPNSRRKRPRRVRRSISQN